MWQRVSGESSGIGRDLTNFIAVGPRAPVLSREKGTREAIIGRISLYVLILINSFSMWKEFELNYLLKLQCLKLDSIWLHPDD